MNLRWANVPVPEAHIGAIVAAASLHAVMPLRLRVRDPARAIAAFGLVATGVGLAAWAVASAGEADVERSSELITRGPYAMTRNPMYLDPVVPYNQSELLYKASMAAGNEARFTLVPGAGHATEDIIDADAATTWATSLGGPETEEAGVGPSWDEIEAFIQTHLDRAR